MSVVRPDRLETRHAIGDAACGEVALWLRRALEIGDLVTADAIEWTDGHVAVDGEIGRCGRCGALLHEIVRRSDGVYETG